ncbi:hypothetical protein [Xenorhabdus sp. IM139775]|uniref:hypothetical protein n=1 Tax=Xenorhabdus sp. IM139775 TaxID=3025876 RepID=UPI002358CF0E|nr:hypothetical protein [Xenorhabdus sp. IM139775]MDC9592432.1 hypothetical protein [Xenorhabdus sp. IM139775]
MAIDRLYSKQEYQAFSTITFSGFTEIEQALADANLIATNIFGNWQEDAYHDQAEEMIFIVRKNKKP